MDVTFESTQGRMSWTIPQEAAPLIQNLPPEQQQRVIDVFQKSLQIVTLFMLQSMGNRQLAQHLEGIMNIMTDLLKVAQVEQQQQG